MTNGVFGPITNLQAVITGPTQVTLSWDPVATAIGYEVERDSVLLTANQPSAGFVDPNASPGVTHTYRVRGFRITQPPTGGGYQDVYPTTVTT